jgi:hypothetical protein
MRRIGFAAMIAASLALAACGTLVGGGAGAGAGYALGGKKGALIGGGVGAAAGTLCCNR